MPPKKILILRFSSIGDVMLTTPVIRCIKQQLPGVELHYVTKAAFKSLLAHNPNVDKLITFRDDVNEVADQLKSEAYDHIVDLHKNLRSFRLKRRLHVESSGFPKLNIQKFLAVRFKMISVLPDRHIVDRYFHAVSALGVKNDGGGLDHFIAPEDHVNVKDLFRGEAPEKFIALVLGGSYYTKKIPLNKLGEICKNASLPLVLLGGKEEWETGEALANLFARVINACGKLSINQSASVIRQATWVITSDTGLMHIAAAFRKNIISVWGNTIPEFGMGPYLPATENRILEVKGLSCRPCSKLGYRRCPRGHFKCMHDIDYTLVKDLR